MMQRSPIPTLDLPSVACCPVRLLRCSPISPNQHCSPAGSLSKGSPRRRRACVSIPARGISAVMVPDEDGPEIPFTATYGIVEQQRRIQFKFTDPVETVTISLLDLAQEGTQLTYSNVGNALTGRRAALTGVERMLDALEREFPGRSAPVMPFPLTILPVSVQPSTLPSCAGVCIAAMARQRP